MGVVLKNNEYKWSGNRPAFTKDVCASMREPNLDRCHSVSWELLSGVVLNLLNSGSTDNVRTGISFLTNTMIAASFLYAYSINLTGNKNLKTFSNILIEAYDEDCFSVSGKATDYLIELNSCRANLRYPKNEQIHWNRSTGGAYDPKGWCYVNSHNKVESDESGIKKEESVLSYEPLKGKSSVPGAGYYFTDTVDGFFIGRLKENRFSACLSKSFLYTYHYVNSNGVRVMASSSNCFAIDKNTNQDTAKVYYYYEDRWRLF